MSPGRRCQSKLAGGWSSNKSPSTLIMIRKELSIIIARTHQPESDYSHCCSITINLYLHWGSSPCFPCGDCSTGLLKGQCLLPRPVVVGETSFTSVTHVRMHFPVFSKGLHQCCYPWKSAINKQVKPLKSGKSLSIVFCLMNSSSVTMYLFWRAGC